MCGFVGYMKDQLMPITAEERDQLEQMTNIIGHRGPDDEGYFVDDHMRLGFRRLSIIDVENGKQPLSYENERYWIIFNGEIYNYVELREKLVELGYPFETHSDTEVILALYSYKGEKVVHDLRGMFAFVIWDKQEQEMVAARDPFGIKPFFYLEEGDTLYMASEKKSIIQMKQGDQVNHEALQHYLTYQYVPEPLTASMSIKKLEPGSYMKKKIGGETSIRTYWSPLFQTMLGTKESLVAEIRDTLRQSVLLHMRSDVPVGAFLSGGIDSTSIVALAKEFHPNIQTFTVGFERDGFSEIDLAQESAEELGVENHNYLVTPEEFIQELPKIIWHMDDPVADPAAIPLYFVAREASKKVKVVLSGEGADELFGGYNIYREPLSLKYFDYIPEGIKQMLKRVASFLPEGAKGKSFIERGSTSIRDRYIGNAKMFSEQEKKELLKGYDPEFHYHKMTHPLYEQIDQYHDVTKMQFIDLHTWLRGDILVKADRMTMAHSLELRVPFLDKEVFKVAAKLDLEAKVGHQTTKYYLREAMRGIIPESALTRKKLGFPVPIRHWMREELLFNWVNQLVTESPTEYLFHKEKIFQLIEKHREGQGDYSRKIWTVVVFLLWHQIYVENAYSFSQDSIAQYTGGKRQPVMATD